MQKVKHAPSLELLSQIAAALGESPEDTKRRGPEVLGLLFHLFEDNENKAGKRSSQSVLGSRLWLAAELADTLQRGGTDDYINGNQEAAALILAELERLQEVTDCLKRRCEKALEFGGRQGPIQS